MAGDFVYNDRSILRELFYVSVLRGEDSAGIAGVRKNGDVTVAKVVGQPYDLFQDYRYNKAESLNDAQALIGHVRKATIGGIGKHTAHPFDTGRYVGVHNGTLDNHHQIPIEGNYPSDSATLFASFEEHGVENTIEFIKGAYALVWWDREDKTLNFLRNDKRDLWYAFGENYNRLYWASEWRMMSLVMNRNSVKLQADQDGATYFPIPVDTWFKYKVAQSSRDKMTLVHSKELKGGAQNPFLEPKWRRPTTGVTTLNGVVIDRGTGVSDKGGSVVNPFPQGVPGAILLERQKERLAEKRRQQEELNDDLPAILRNQAESTTTNTSSQHGKDKPQTSGHQSKTLLTLVRENKDDGLTRSRSKSIIKLAEQVVVGRNGLLLDERLFAAAIEDGCVWCQDNDLSFVDEARHSAGEKGASTKIAKWIIGGGFVCSGCIDEVNQCSSVN